MKVGDTVTTNMITSLYPKDNAKAFPGRCIYIHPNRRFYVLEFELHGRKLREAYSFQYRRGEG